MDPPAILADEEGKGDIPDPRRGEEAFAHGEELTPVPVELLELDGCSRSSAGPLAHGEEEEDVEEGRKRLDPGATPAALNCGEIALAGCVGSKAASSSKSRGPEGRREGIWWYGCWCRW